jgi:uncharacterized protein YyaL (SSP411 family)
MKNVIWPILALKFIAIGAVIMSVTLGWSAKASSSSEFNSQSSGQKKYGTLPGIGKFDIKLLQKFEEMRKVRKKDYKPRTRHLRPDGRAKYTNRLFLESSPYLIQHAHNPINWYPWSDEAFETAKKLKLPVLLSVGYSTCHWCHVMEEESFEDEEIARYMNENYIAIKVDREVRPDIDAIYMAAVQALTGRGGWPMTVWLTPNRKPFYGGTYFPARDGDRGANIGFLTLLKKLKNVYDTQQDRVVQVSQELTTSIQQMLSPKTGEGMPVVDIMLRAANYYKDRFDSTYGGLTGAPKFPSSLPVRFLFRYHRHTGESEIVKIAQLTLGKMAAGGIYDHVAGGFHRYSTDEQWLEPHFEKMLYDNALLIMAYLEGYQVLGDEDFERIAREILRYVKRDMTSPDGAFYSATDADSLTPSGHREEGYFFTWSSEESVNVIGKDRAEVVKKYYAVSSGGNFEGRNILHTPQTTASIAKSLKISEKKLEAIINESKEILYQARSRKPPPLRDEKILTSWNGLMISAHARAGLILANSQYTDRAIQAAQFVLKRLYINNRLYRSYKDNKAYQNAYLDDYAFLTAALLDLYEATQDPQWLKNAIEIDRLLEKNFEDMKNGGFFMTSNNHEELLTREKPTYDGALPSGNSIAVLNLLRLSEYTTKESYWKRAEKALKSFSGILTTNPVALSEMLLAVDFYLDNPKEIIIVAPKGKTSETGSFLSEFRKQFLPNRILTVVTEGKELESHAKIIPLVQGKLALNGKATAYVCEKRICKLPTNDPKVFAQQIREVEELIKVSK